MMRAPVLRAVCASASSLMLLLSALGRAGATATLPPCRARDLSIGVDPEGGAFNGMSHAGVLLVLRDVSARACAVPALPELTFLGADGRVLPIVRQAPPGMQPGPAAVPVPVAPGAEVTAPLRWVSGGVFDGGRCLTTERVRATVGGAPLEVAFPAHTCGPADGPVTFTQPFLKVDPPPPPPDR